MEQQQQSVVKGVPHVKVSKYSHGDVIFNIFLYGIAAVMLIIVIYPMWFIVIASVSNPAAVATGKVWFWPSGFTLDGYKELINRQNIWVGYRNTIAYVLVGTTVGLIVNIPAAYALSRRDLVGRKALTLFYVFTMFFNGGLIPTYMVVKDLGLYNTFAVMVLPFSVVVYHIIVARTFFSTSIPDGLWDAAQIDGCGNLRFFFTMVLPLSKAILAVLALWTAVGHWNAYFNALIYLQDESRFPLQLILRSILIINRYMASVQGVDEAALQARKVAEMIKYASIIVSTVPIMCLYPFVQKNFNQGVMVGSIKE